MRAATEISPDGRRGELGDFLRRRRAEISTDMAGLPTTRRRRTPGLRREEVAELANISTALYSWLEQGRDVPVSRRTVDAVASALQLSPSERDHIYALAAHESGALHEVVSPTFERFVHSLATHPVFVIDHKWDIVLYNRAADMIFGNGEDIPKYTNLLEATFEMERRALFLDWREVAESLVELFRYDYALYAAEPGPIALVERLRASDPTFAEIWEQHRVRRSPSALRRINHPRAGSLTVEPSLYAVVESPGLRFMVYTPADEDTARRFAVLVAGTARPTNGSSPVGAALREPADAVLR